MEDNLTPFLNPDAVGTYTQDTQRKVPGLAALHRMVTILLGEGAPAAAHILAVGAGGGLELKAMAEQRAGWRFTGVDPSPAMLDIARRTTAPHADRIELRTGTIDQAPSGPFDGATCLLMLHFLDRNERLRTLKQIHTRLKPGRPLVVAHHSMPESERRQWLTRSAAFAGDVDFDAKSAAGSVKAMAERLPLLAPSEDEALFLEAGFSEPALFYAAFSFRGWLALAGQPSTR
ncbi:MAG: class I SAM-dependent methyltransferase [Rhizobium sp.]|nr:class I SAM-dependent methyltransferase [Rhizobium sp.]